MNRTHRRLWNSARGAWVAAPENTRARGKRSRVAEALALTAALGGQALALPFVEGFSTTALVARIRA